MTITPRVWDFPTIPISKQLFHVPGGALQGGLTAGSAQIITPEPGGFSVLEIQPSLQDDEWQVPFSSWLMSQGNGRILRVRLSRTPQIITSRSMHPPQSISSVYNLHPITGNPQVAAFDLTAIFTTAALEGTNEIVINMAAIGNILRIGHVIGHNYDTYLVDEISYDENNQATIIVNPPFRRDIAINDVALFRPYFTGRISNVSEILATYDAENAGNIQLGKIIFNEAVL